MKGRKHKNTGGVNEAEEDVKTKAENRSYTGDPKDPSPVKEAEELKKGGRAKRKFGGKSEMKVEGGEAEKHAGRKPRASGGRSDMNPFTSAHKGTNPKGRSEMMESED
jgi:hypothetical protein